MSRIHEALRRGDKSAQPSTKSPRSAHSDTILATLGYPAESSAANPQRRLVARTARDDRVCCRVLRVAVLAVSAIGSDTRRPSSRTPWRHRGVAPRPTPSPPHRRRLRVLVRRRLPWPRRPRWRRSAVKPARPSPAAARPRRSDRRRNDFQLALYYQRAGEFDRAFAPLQGCPPARRAERRGAQQPRAALQEQGPDGRSARGVPPRDLDRAAVYVAAHNNLGVTLLELGRVDAAAAEFRSVLALEPRQRRRDGEPGARAAIGRSRRRTREASLSTRARHRAAQRRRALQPRPAVRGHRRRACAPSSTTRRSCNTLDPSTRRARTSARASSRSKHGSGSRLDGRAGGNRLDMMPSNSASRRTAHVGWLNPSSGRQWLMTEIDALLKEDRRFPPSAEWRRTAIAERSGRVPARRRGSRSLLGRVRPRARLDPAVVARARVEAAARASGSSAAS